MIDYKDMEKRLEDALNKETRESLLEWLKNHKAQIADGKSLSDVEAKVKKIFAEETFELVINNLLENRPLYKDSGLWQIRTDDMEEVLYQQNTNETFIEFINRVFKSENQLQDL